MLEIKKNMKNKNTLATSTFQFRDYIGKLSYDSLYVLHIHDESIDKKFEINDINLLYIKGIDNILIPVKNTIFKIKSGKKTFSGTLIFSDDENNFFTFFISKDEHICSPKLTDITF